MKPNRVVTAAACLLATSVFAAVGKNCEELRTEVAAKFRARGVNAPNIEILPAAQTTSARTVGTCELGTKQLVFFPGEYNALPAASSHVPKASPACRARDEILTECKDGTVSVGGSCGRK